MEIFEELDPETASDTLEEIEPAVQRDLVEALDVDKVARLIDEMTTGQAADVLSSLSSQESADILKRLDPENARKIQTILERQEENILDFATQEYLAFPPEAIVGEVEDQYRHLAKGKDVIMYIYVLDQAGKLKGVLDIKELLQADETAALKDVMVDDVISLDPDSTLKEASERFSRYDFRALPITANDDKLLGVVTYRDVIGLKHRFIE